MSLVSTFHQFACLRIPQLDEGFKKKMEKVMSILVTIAVDYGDVAFTVGNGKVKPPRIAPVGKSQCDPPHRRSQMTD